MSVITIPASRTTTDSEMKDIGRLAAELRAHFAAVQPEDVNLAIAEALGAVSVALGVESCRLIEFTDNGTVARVHAPAGTSTTVIGRHRPPAPDGWLVTRLSRGQIVVISRPEELPTEAVAAREAARRTMGYSILGVPAPIAGPTVCALTIEATGVSRRWPQSLIESVQQIAGSMSSMLQPRRRMTAPRPDVEEISRLNARLEADNRYLKEEIKTIHDFEEIVGESAALRLGLARLAQVAPMNSSVLLLGPTGTGKELFARAVHERSRRHARAMVRVNCAALPPTLVESELFGHEKGAFTGAVGVRQGRFELADGGTIFLDEIGDLPLEIQVKFLRVLQEGEFERVGSSRSKRVDVRVIAATHHNLEAAVAEGRFRADLYYRLSGYPIHLPSLQDRVDDIPRLVWFFIHRHQRDLGRHITKIPQGVMDALQGYAWPGNVRELQNVVERAMIASEGDTLQLDAPLALRPRSRDRAEAPDNLDAVQRAHIETILE